MCSLELSIIFQSSILVAHFIVELFHVFLCYVAYENISVLPINDVNSQIFRDKKKNKKKTWYSIQTFTKYFSKMIYVNHRPKAHLFIFHEVSVVFHYIIAKSVAPREKRRKIYIYREKESDEIKSYLFCW